MKGHFTHIVILLALGTIGLVNGQENQITVDRIELMPNEPSPFNIPDWHTIAQQYDSFVYDLDKTGQYLPLITIRPTGLNYPSRPSFGMHSYVGTVNTDAGEAINILPSLVGATLTGINKSDQHGMNWVLMSQDYFNRGNGEFLYLNNSGGHSGNDWWYDMMPNIYFYQLYDLYGGIGDATFQFTKVADRFLESVRGLGGNDTPWQKAFMEYRAWDFINMVPNDQGVIEPEAAGAYAWILYHAFNQTGNPEYLKGAEWSIEFLHTLGYNPSYELQLPYGTYIAAKMNAELNTKYNIEKFMYWSFNRGAIRGWGTIVGNWGGLDVSGLVGEANDNGNDYAFQMNGVQQAAALVPMVRYDKRFSRAVGKWFINLANATRLMYPGYLPATHQDASEWSEEYDPDRIIGYEALREKLNGLRPFSTGDALKGGWAGTNLAIYGNSSIGYLGALYQRTNQEKILLIDLLKTDFLGDTAYPSYLLFNPYPGDRQVLLDVGEDLVDIYDAISETFISEGVSGNVSIDLKSDEVRSLVYSPAGGTITFEENLMMINGVVVDYDQHEMAYNTKPRIQALATQNPSAEFGDTIAIYGTAIDRETKNLIYVWETAGGVLIGDDEEVSWVAPEIEGTHDITLIVWDEGNSSDTAVLQISTVPEVNIPPHIISLEIDQQYAEPDEAVIVQCVAFDENGDSLSYTWSANGGSFDGTGGTVNWQSPNTSDIYILQVVVEDEKGAKSNAQIKVLVNEFQASTGDLIAHYPFNTNANDESGNDLHGIVKGAKITSDRFGNPNSAYFFDGINDHISITNEDILNFTGAITVSVWVEPGSFSNNEAFIISHGSWQNRWKVSIIPDKRIRWTLKTSSGQIKDIDSNTRVEEDEAYQVTVTYDGSLLMLYVNGKLESFSKLSGEINPTIYDMEFGQMLPDMPEYNFRGVLDDIMIYNYALHPDTIAESIPVSTNELTDFSRITAYPNPASDQLTVDLKNSEFNHEDIRLSLYDLNGRLIKTETKFRIDEQIHLSTKDLHGGVYYLELKSSTKKHTIKFVKLE